MAEKRKIGGASPGEMPPPPAPEPLMTWGQLKAAARAAKVKDEDVVLLSDPEGNAMLAVHTATREKDEYGPYLWLRGRH